MKAISPCDAILLRPGAVILLVLALALGNSHLFAQIGNSKKPAKKTGNPIVRALRDTGDQPSPAGTVFGLGNGAQGLFVSPAMLGSVTLGVGSICTLSPPKDSMFGSGAWNCSPALVVLSTHGPLVFGASVGNFSQFSDSSDSFNGISTLIQPLINYSMPGGWYVKAVPTAGEEMCCGKHLIVPLGPCVGKIHCFGELPVNLQLGAYYNSEKSTDGPSWQLRLQFQFPFPQ